MRVKLVDGNDPSSLHDPAWFYLATHGASSAAHGRPNPGYSLAGIGTSHILSISVSRSAPDEVFAYAEYIRSTPDEICNYAEHMPKCPAEKDRNEASKSTYNWQFLIDTDDQMHMRLSVLRTKIDVTKYFGFGVTSRG